MLLLKDLNPVTATLFAAEERLEFLPSLFGYKLMMRGEALIFDWMRSLSKSYDGGFWNYFKLSNGGFFMAPASTNFYSVSCPGNQFEGVMSANAVGIVSTLFALGQLAAESESGSIVDHYFLVLEYVEYHPERSLIFKAID
jgi:hypothetical protein